MRTPHGLDPAAPDSLDRALRGLRVAVVHDQLYTIGGAEKVLAEILELIPHADLYALYTDMATEQLEAIVGPRRTVTTTFIQKLPNRARFRKFYLPIMPMAIESLDLSQYDVIISSSYMFAKGIICTPDQLHVCYIHTPMRFALDQKFGYLSQIRSNLGLRRLIATMVVHYLRQWDVCTANSVDEYVANSEYVARRVERAYRRTSLVVYPPVGVEPLLAVPRSPVDTRNKFVTMSRLVEGKRIDLLIDAFGQCADLELTIIGDGALRSTLEARAGSNVKFVGRLPTEEAMRLIAESAAFVYAADEDFGIVVVEAQAVGTPVIALRKGGTLETVIGLDDPRGHPTGVFFDRQDPDGIAQALRVFQANTHRFSAEACRLNARKFSTEEFRRGFSQMLLHALSRRRSRHDHVGQGLQRLAS